MARKTLKWGASSISYIMAEELEAEFDLLQLRTSDSRDETQQQARPLPSKTIPPTTKLHKVYGLRDIDTVWKGKAQQSTKLPSILAGEIHTLMMDPEQIATFFFFICQCCLQLPT